MDKKLGCINCTNCSKKVCIKNYFNKIPMPLPRIFQFQRNLPKQESFDGDIKYHNMHDGSGNVDDVEIINFDEKYNDPGTWPYSLTNLEIDYIVDKGPERHTGINFPKTSNSQCFNEDLYWKRQKGKLIDRTWLVYSKTNDSIICFACKLFQHENNDEFCSNGFNDWKRARRALIHHETTISHYESFTIWTNRKEKINKFKPKIDENIIEL